jgi:choline dehydrogenase-like flavoprotein
MILDPDVIVVGSGASGTSAAFPLVRAGLRVLMLDVGTTGQQYTQLIPDAPFQTIRRTDGNQHRYFLGDRFEGLPFGDVRVGAQLTPPRQFISRHTGVLTPVRTSTFAGLESLALGGLAAGWGAVAVQFDDVDLAGWPIRHKELVPHYEAVSARIGVSGARDDLLRHYGDCPSLQPPLDVDSNGETILARYETRREALNRAGLVIGRARLAVLSRDLNDRRAHSYNDMDFYADSRRSVFRPAFAVDELSRVDGFSYARPYLVERFRETGNRVHVEARHAETGARETFSARALVLAAGTLGTARIVLRSFDRYDTPVPLVSNPYVYVPCVNTAMLGKPAKDRRHSLTQIGAMYTPPGDPRRRVHAQAYSYRSLLLFKIAKEVPLALPCSLSILRDVVNAFVILGIHHEDRPAAGKTCTLRRGVGGAPDILDIDYRESADVLAANVASETAMLRAFRRVGCWALRRQNPGHGASIHYGGTVPMTREERELTVTPHGRLRGARSVYCADGSGFPSLPAKALTLTLMANAERVGTRVCEELDSCR